jgi:hypothetical protein
MAMNGRTVGVLMFAGLVASAGISLQSGTHQAKSPESPATCDTDWHKCADNRDLLEHYNRYKLFVACQMEAENLVKYREPKWPGIIGGGAFHDRFLEGDSFIKTGKATLIETRAQFQNQNGAMVHSTARCVYDLNADKVLDVSVVPN